MGLCRRRRRRLGGGGYGRLSCISKFVLHIITAIITKYYSSFNPVLNRRLHFYSLSVGLFATGCSKCYFTTDKLAKFSFYICVNVLIRFFYLLVRILVACLFHSLLFVFFFYKSIYLKKRIITIPNESRSRRSISVSGIPLDTNRNSPILENIFGSTSTPA